MSNSESSVPYFLSECLINSEFDNGHSFFTLTIPADINTTQSSCGES